MRTLVSSALLFVLASCATDPTATPAPEPAVARAMELRAASGLRADRAWVEQVLGDPDAVERWGIKVSPGEAARIDADELRDAISDRERLGLQADEAWVREVMAAPDAVRRMGLIVSPAEAERIDRGVAAIQDVIGTVNAYGRDHPEEWAGRYLDEAGIVHVLVTGHADEHERAIESLFAGAVDIRVDQVRWTMTELLQLRKKVRDPAFHRWLARRGISIEAFGIAERANRVDIEVETAPTERDVERLIVEHLGAEEWLIVHIDVVTPAVELPLGGLRVAVVDGQGRELVDGRLVLRADVRVNYADDASATCDLDERNPGVCRWDAIPATGYTVQVWRGYQRGFLGSGRAIVPADGMAEITIVVDVAR